MAGVYRRRWHRVPRRAFTLSKAPSGILYQQTLTGDLTFSGSLAKRTAKALSGALSFSGSISRVISHVLAGTLTFAGDLKRSVARALSSAVSFSGSVIKTAKKVLSSSLSFAGAISTRAISHILSGALSFSGDLKRSVTRSLAGVLSFSGNLNRSQTRSLSGTLSFSGAYAAILLYVRSFTGSLSFSGAISKSVRHVVAGTLSFSGTANRSIVRQLAGILNLSSSGSPSIEQHFEMQVGPFNGSGTLNTYATLRDISTRLNTADFDGTVEYYFEADIFKTGTDGACYAQLYNLTDGAAVSGSEIFVNFDGNSQTKRVRSGALSLSGDKIYVLQLKSTTGNQAQANSYGSRIIIKQSGNFTKTQIQIELGGEQTTSSTSNANILSRTAKFLYEASKYDGSVAIRHDANVRTTSGNTVTSGIYDITAGSVVSSSEVTKTNDTNYSLLSSGNISLTDGHIYSPTAYVSAGASVAFESSKLVITITGGFTKFLAYLMASNQGGSGYSTTNSAYQYLADSPTLFNPNFFANCTVNYYHEADLSISNAAQTGYAILDTYTYPSTTTGDISGTEVSVTGSTARQRARSSAFSLPSGDNEFAIGIKSTGAATVSLTQSYVIVEVTGFGGGGGLIKRTNKALSGALSFGGSLIKTISRSLAGVLSFSGLLASLKAGLTIKSLTGDLSFSGNLSRSISHVLIASLTFSGNLIRSMARSLTGALSFGGSLVKKAVRTLTGSLSFSGSLRGSPLKNLVGSLGFSGSLSRAMTRAFTGTLSFGGSLLKKTVKSLTGSLSFSGVMSAITSKALSFAASLSFSGSLTRTIKRAFSGVSSFSGTLNRSTVRAFNASISFSGNLVRKPVKAFSATLSFSGTMLKRIGKALAGSVSFSGSFIRSVVRSLTANLSFSGLLATARGVIQSALNASLSFSGALVTVATLLGQVGVKIYSVMLKPVLSVVMQTPLLVIKLVSKVGFTTLNPTEKAGERQTTNPTVVVKMRAVQFTKKMASHIIKVIMKG